MYLTCPQCETVYTVRAAMLREGQGEVRCGACQTLFNALDYLSDELPESTQEAGGGEPQVPAGEELVSPTGEGSAVPGLDEVPSSSDIPDLRPEQQPDVTPTMQIADAGEIPHALSREWGAQAPDPRARSRNLGAVSLAIVLLLGLAVQYMWFAPRDLLARFPQAAYVVERFCGLTGCMVPERRAPGRIQILSREVRAHPRYRGALLVSAAFSNVAPWPQPFPHLRFQLYDVNGQTIASRVFTPSQYLAGAVPASNQFPPGKPLQVALEMLAPEEASVSFEFSFQ